MLFFPINVLIAIANKINELIASETSEGAIKDKLLKLQMKLETNQISPEEYDKLEAELLELLEKTREKEE